MVNRPRDRITGCTFPIVMGISPKFPYLWYMVLLIPAIKIVYELYLIVTFFLPKHDKQHVLCSSVDLIAPDHYIAY